MIDPHAVAQRIATATGASAEIVESILRQESAAAEAAANRRERRYRVAMDLLRELASEPDLSDWPTEASVLPGFRAPWRAQQLLRGEEL
jgi:hypothetical protein